MSGITLKNVSNIDTESVFIERGNGFLGKKTAIVTTLGPACWSVEGLVELIDAGANVFRFNFSHGDHESHQACLGRVREALKLRPEVKIGLLLDTKGPEIRTGFFRDGLKAIELVKDQSLKIVTDYSFLGDNTAIACTYDKLPQSVQPGNIILMADGSLSVEVTEVHSDYVMTRVMNNAKVGERKNMNLPGVKVDLPVCGDREISDFLDFGIPNCMHFIAASFVQCAEDIKQIRQVLGEKGKHFKIIPKIENQEGIKNFDEILEECDGVMCARGDMGMEIPLEKVFLAQKMMVNKCNLAGKPIIVATQMLESMITAPRPTRAEVSDVANAVLDGCDAVMLSGESANGLFPKNAVETLAKTAFEAENTINTIAVLNQIKAATIAKNGELSAEESIACDVVVSAVEENAAAILVVSDNGESARLIAKYKPSMPIYALTTSEIVASQMSLLRGVRSMVVESVADKETVVAAAIQTLKSRGVTTAEDKVIVA